MARTTLHSAGRRARSYKLIEFFETEGRVELYDLERDPGAELSTSSEPQSIAQ